MFLYVVYYVYMSSVTLLFYHSGVHVQLYNISHSLMLCCIMFMWLYFHIFLRLLRNLPLLVNYDEFNMYIVGDAI